MIIYVYTVVAPMRGRRSLACHLNGTPKLSTSNREGRDGVAIGVALDERSIPTAREATFDR